MNVKIIDEARLDIADGVALYDRQNYGAGGTYFNFDKHHLLVNCNTSSLLLPIASI